MKIKIFNLLLIITSLFGFLEWGNDKQSFLFQVEAEFLSKLFIDPVSVIHPLTLLPFLGQIGLVVTLFQKQPSRILTYTSIGCLAILLVLMLVVGLMNFNFKIILSTLPFIVLSVLTILTIRK